MSESVNTARRDALLHAMSVLSTAANLLGTGHGEVALLLAAREQIAKRGLPGAPGSTENEAGAAERSAILNDVDAAIRGANRASGYDALTWAEMRVQERLSHILF